MLLTISWLHSIGIISSVPVNVYLACYLAMPRVKVHSFGKQARNKPIKVGLLQEYRPPSPKRNGTRGIPRNSCSGHRNLR